MTRRPWIALLGVLLAAPLGGCHMYYFAHATVPLSVPADSACLRATLAERGRFGTLDMGKDERRKGTVAYSTPAMFHGQWQTVAQLLDRDSSMHRGTVYRDSGAILHSTYVQLDRRIEPSNGELLTADMARSLLELRDRCGGRSPGDEPVYSVEVTDSPYRAWIARGTAGRVRLRLTVDSIRYRLRFALNAGRHVLRVDTLGGDVPSRFARWIEVDTLELPAVEKGTTVATECWRGDTEPDGTLVALARKPDWMRYLVDILGAWVLDRETLQLSSTAVDGVECINEDSGGPVGEAPRQMRAEALSFRQAPGMSRIYAYVSRPDYSVGDIDYPLNVNGRPVGRLVGGSFLMLDLEPGRHRISNPSWGRFESALEIETAPDSLYFIEVRMKQFDLFTNTTIQRGDPASARPYIRRARMVPSFWLGSPLPR